LYFVVVGFDWFDLFSGRDIDVVVVVGGFTLTEHKPMCVGNTRPQHHLMFDVFIDQPILPTNPQERQSNVIVMMMRWRRCGEVEINHAKRTNQGL